MAVVCAQAKLLDGCSASLLQSPALVLHRGWRWSGCSLALYRAWLLLDLPALQVLDFLLSKE